MSGLRVLEDLGDVGGKRVLVRADLNVPLKAVGDRFEVADDFRIRSTLPTLSWLVEHGAQVTVCSHLGRPKGVPVAKWSMDPVRRELQRIIPEVEVMENLRFNSGEEGNSEEFARTLAEPFDLFVLDAFGVCHRKHASVVLVPKLLPSVGGRTLEVEVKALTKLVAKPPRPYVAVIGGAKVSDKMALLSALINSVDEVLIGGAMAFTFLLSEGQQVGDSLVEPDLVGQCQELIASGKLHLPNDFCALGSEENFGSEENATPGKVISHFGTEAMRGLDIGPATIDTYSKYLASAKSIFWNGPMGVYEDPRFQRGTVGIANAVANSDAYSVVGGGDSAAALRMEGLGDAVSHLSTGGGASLQFLEKGDLPGLEALRESRAS